MLRPYIECCLRMLSALKTYTLPSRVKAVGNSCREGIMVFSPVAIFSMPWLSSKKTQCGLNSCGTFFTDTRLSAPEATKASIHRSTNLLLLNGQVACSRTMLSKYSPRASKYSMACLITSTVGVLSEAKRAGRKKGTSTFVPFADRAMVSQSVLSTILSNSSDSSADLKV